MDGFSRQRLRRGFLANGRELRVVACIVIVVCVVSRRERERHTHKREHTRTLASFHSSPHFFRPERYYSSPVRGGRWTSFPLSFLFYRIDQTEKSAGGYRNNKMSVLSQFCLARWKSVDSLTPTALVYNLSRFVVCAPRSDITTRSLKNMSFCLYLLQ